MQYKMSLFYFKYIIWSSVWRVTMLYLLCLFCSDFFVLSFLCRYLVPTSCVVINHLQHQTHKDPDTDRTHRSARCYSHRSSPFLPSSSSSSPQHRPSGTSGGRTELQISCTSNTEWVPRVRLVKLNFLSHQDPAVVSAVVEAKIQNVLVRIFFFFFSK